jgi:glycosyltransferase involved in cell wall biosynthesis
LKHNGKPALLLLTSSFPCSPDDETCGYIRDFARSLSVEFDVTVLAPPDRRAIQWPRDAFTLTRSRSVLPLGLDTFKAGDDLNHLASGSLLAKLAALVSLFCFFARALALALRADAVCSHWMIPSGLIGASICRLLGKPHVVVEHSGALHLLTRIRGGRTIARFIVEGSDRIVTVSADLKRKLIALSPETKGKVEVMPMGISVTSTSTDAMTTNPSTRTILFIGRLTEIKGLDVLLKAIDGLDDLRLIVAGDGERRDELESLARALSVNARFIGGIGASERERLLSVCDAVVIPSRVLADGRTEGTPVVCLEAMAAGRVVIASRVGGLAEAIVDGENGLLFEQGDHRTLKDKLLLVLSDDSLRRSIAENARRSAAAYDWPRIGLRYAAIIKSALRKNDAIGNRRIEAGSINR